MVIKKFNKVINFFLLSVVFGPAVGYDKLYLFHIALVLLLLVWVRHALNGVNLQLQKRKTPFYNFLIFMFFWYLLSAIWSIEPLYTFRYLLYLFFGISIVYYTIKWCSTEARYDAVFHFIKWGFIAEIIISLLEAANIIRLPTSPYSQYAAYFGRKGTDFLLYDQGAQTLIKSAPTGFLANPNNLAVVLVTILPYFLFSRKKYVKIAGIISIFLVVLFTGSRGSFIAMLLGLLIYLFVTNKRYFIAAIAIGGLSISVLTLSIDALKHSSNQRLADLAYSGDALLSYLSDASEQGGSISVRQQLIKNGLNALWETNGLGVGGGASQAVQERLGSVEGISSMHNFWVEILVDAGVFFFACFVVWYIFLTLRMYTISRKSKNAFYKYHSGALFISFVTFAVACISASSVIYMLTMWLMFGLAIALHLLYTASRKSRIVRNGSFLPGEQELNQLPQVDVQFKQPSSGNL